MTTEAHHLNGQHEIHFILDGEPEETEQRTLTPNSIIRDYGKTDPSTHYLVEIQGAHRVSFQGKGDVPIEIHEGERFQVVSTGPTPVS
jgi:hypothetical protein